MGLYGNDNTWMPPGTAQVQAQDRAGFYTDDDPLGMATAEAADTLDQSEESYAQAVVKAGTGGVSRGDVGHWVALAGIAGGIIALAWWLSGR